MSGTRSSDENANPRSGRPATRIDDLNAPAEEIAAADAADVKGGIDFCRPATVGFPTDQIVLSPMRKSGGDPSP